MKLPFKIVLINTAIAILISLLSFSEMDRMWGGLFLSFGLVGLFGGLFIVVVGLILLFMNDRRYAQGFLLSGGLLMLLGFIACSNLGH